MRNQDNFLTAYDYLKNQILIYNYNTYADLVKVKMKLLILDGIITDEEYALGIKETDINVPVNHWEALNNEIIFLDRYVRTKDGDLLENEDSFSLLKSQRLGSLIDFISQINPYTGFRNKAEEAPYSIRPTLLTDSQFQDLYTTYKTKEANGEFQTAFEIISKPVDANIGSKIKNQETSLLNFVPPVIVMAKLLDTATKKVAKEDDYYVDEMNDAYTELLNIVISTFAARGPYPTWQNSHIYAIGDRIEVTGVKYICKTTHTSPPFPAIFTPGTQWLAFVENIILVNVPTRRNRVIPTAGHSSHKGSINAGEGYRFVFRDKDGNETIVTYVITDVSPIKTGEVEWQWDFFRIANLYPNATGQMILEDLHLDIASLPNGGDHLGDLTIERFNELNDRWVNMNEYRENQIAKTGTRIQVEAMVNAVVPNLYPDIEKTFQTLKNLKGNFTNILKEKCSEFF